MFSDALLTRDTNALEPDVAEFKLYVKDVGPVLTLDVSGGGGGREELLSVEQVPPDTATGRIGRAVERPLTPFSGRFAVKSVLDRDSKPVLHVPGDVGPAGQG